MLVRQMPTVEFDSWRGRSLAMSRRVDVKSTGRDCSDCESHLNRTRASASSACKFLSQLTRLISMYYGCGGERGPVTFPAFKAGDAFLRGTGGGFDFHTLPPQIINVYAGICDVLLIVQRRFSGLLHQIGATDPAGLAFPGGADGFFHLLLTLCDPLGIVLSHDLFGVAEYGFHVLCC